MQQVFFSKIWRIPPLFGLADALGKVGDKMGRRGKKRPIRKRISLDRGKEEREDEKDASTQLCQRKGEKKPLSLSPFLPDLFSW